MRISVQALGTLVGLAVMAATPAAHAAPYGAGNVLAAVGNSQVKEFTPGGALVQTLTAGIATSFNTGMCFDADGNLYVTHFDGENVAKFDPDGAFTGAFGSGYDSHPESCSLDGAGNVYVGQADGTRDILKFSPAGALLDAFDAPPGNRGTDFIDLAADQCTMFYNSEDEDIRRYDVCADAPLPDFATGFSTAGECYSLRVRLNGEVISACTGKAYRLSPTGAVLQEYTPPGSGHLLFAMNLDPDGTSFWTGDLTSTGTVFRFDIETGALLGSFDTNANTAMAGLAVVGELRAAVTSASVADASATEGTGGTTAVPVEVRLSNPVGKDVTISWRTVDGSARAGDDFTAVSSGQVTIPANATSAQLTLQVVADSADEADETLEIELFDPNGATLSDARATVTIVDDDAPAAAVAAVAAQPAAAATQPAAAVATATAASRRCGSRRAFTIRLRDHLFAKRRDILDVIVAVRGKRIPVRFGRRITARIDFRGLPRSTFVDGKGRPRKTFNVDITLILDDGTMIKRQRRYLLCTSKRATLRPPPL